MRRSPWRAVLPRRHKMRKRGTHFGSEKPIVRLKVGTVRIEAVMRPARGQVDHQPCSLAFLLRALGGYLRDATRLRIPQLDLPSAPASGSRRASAEEPPVSGEQGISNLDACFSATYASRLLYGGGVPRWPDLTRIFALRSSVPPSCCAPLLPRRLLQQSKSGEALYQIVPMSRSLLIQRRL